MSTRDFLMSTCNLKKYIESYSLSLSLSLSRSYFFWFFFYIHDIQALSLELAGERRSVTLATLAINDTKTSNRL